jgi:hypothetical protein
MSKIFIFPNMGDDLPELVTNVHSRKLLASFQILVDEGVLSSVVINELDLELAAKLYSSVFSHLNIESHQQTGGSIIKPHVTNE